jgi:hypothetical protein
LAVSVWYHRTRCLLCDCQQQQQQQPQQQQPQPQPQPQQQQQQQQGDAIAAAAASTRAVLSYSDWGWALPGTLFDMIVAPLLSGCLDLEHDATRVFEGEVRLRP